MEKKTRTDNNETIKDEYTIAIGILGEIAHCMHNCSRL